MTQLEEARKGVITEAMRRVAQKENVSPEILRDRMAEGSVVIPANIKHTDLDPVGIGKGLTIKVNANIGTSRDHVDLDEEIKKLSVAVDAKADTVMDLSTGGDITRIRQAILQKSSVPVGTVPIYQAAVEAVKKIGGIIHLTPDLLFEAVQAQADDGVSRGGAFLATWMLHHQRENPFFEDFGRLLAIARQYDITLSLGDGLRPGSLADATDRAQIHELLTLGELTQKAWDAGVQIIIEGPGHIALHEIEANVVLQKRLCQGAPFYVLGPLVTDIAAGYDHIACAIGGAVAGMAGADFLCYVTPAEHLKLPSTEDVREGVIASRIAAHGADIARGHQRAIAWDLEMSKARKALDWNRQISLSVDPRKAKAYRENSQPSSDEVCTMCGEFCAIKIVRDYFRS
jgi:phosphomethylpyrimidine synthase